MARFFGRYEHSLDAKGRVILPARFRPAFEHGGFLSQYHDGCLALWTPEEFDKQMADMLATSEVGRAERNLARVWASGTHEVEVDRQGRMPIPAFLREFADLQADGEILVHGAIDRIELWNPGSWEQRVKPVERRLTEGDEAT